ARLEAVDRLEPRSSRAFRDLAAVAVDRMCGQRRQRLARGEEDAGAQVDRHLEPVAAVDLHLMRAIERQWPLAQGAEKPHVAPISELRNADRRVARVVGREIEERCDSWIGLAVVVAEESLERAAQTREPIRGLERPSISEALVGRDLDGVVAMNGLFEARAQIAGGGRRDRKS